MGIAHTIIHFYHLAPREEISLPHYIRILQAARPHITSVSGSNTKKLIYPIHFKPMTLSLPTPDLINQSHQMCRNLFRRSPTLSLFMHWPLLSIHFYDTQPFFLAPPTFLFYKTLCSHHPSIHYSWPSSQLYTSHIWSHYLLYQSVVLSMHSNHLNTLCSVWPANSHSQVPHNVNNLVFCLL